MIHHFELNEKGNDYVVGDIHGCFDLLKKQLEEIGFDSSKDRLFGVGDLVDRGPDSEEALVWLEYPWFFSVLGNHEQMVIERVEDGHTKLHIDNGGEWLNSVPMESQRDFVDAFKKLPIFIEIETKEGLVGIVHGECPFKTWAEVSECMGKPLRNYMKEWCIWGRDRISKKDTSMVEGISKIFCGHTIVLQPEILGNVHYIDTGAFLGRDLTIRKIS